MENVINTKDALGSVIELGKKYAYIQNTNGFTTVVIGIAEKFTKVGITIKIESATRALYSYEAKKINFDKEKVSVKCINLFPIK